MSNPPHLSIRPLIVLMLVFLVLSGCTARPSTVKPVNDRSEYYQDTRFEGQIPIQTSQELQERYPAGFHENEPLVIPLDQQVRVSFRLFTSNPSQPDISKMVTDTFVNVFVKSNIFNIIEREQIGHLTGELELNQSGLVNQDNAPETGQFSAPEFIITGAIDQVGGRLIDANLLDISTGRVVLSERIVPAAINSQNAKMLARILLTRMKEKFYKVN